jgi:hypothetical protein
MLSPGSRPTEREEGRCRESVCETQREKECEGKGGREGGGGSYNSYFSVSLEDLLPEGRLGCRDSFQESNELAGALEALGLGQLVVDDVQDVIDRAEVEFFHRNLKERR